MPNPKFPKFIFTKPLTTNPESYTPPTQMALNAVEKLKLLTRLIDKILVSQSKYTVLVCSYSDSSTKNVVVTSHFTDEFENTCRF